MSRQTKRFAFDGFILDVEEKVLLRGEERVPIPPKILELLHILVEDHGHVVSKDDLMERLWADTFVEESNLTFSIRKLRKILGDRAQEPRFIETVPKRGYRFIAETAVLASDNGATADVAVARDNTDAEATVTRRSMAGWITALAILIAGVSVVFVYQWYERPPSGIDWSVAQNVHLTDQAGIEYFPSLAPDGKSFVYAADSGSGFDIFHQAVGARERIDLTADFDGDDTQPSFSPDGERIAFRSERDGGGIYVMGILRQGLRRVSDFGYHPSWSPNSRYLAVSTFGRDRITVSTRGEHGIWVIDVESGDKRELYRGLASFPAWSPNGKRIAFWYYGNLSGQSDIATIPADGGEPVPIAEGFGSLNWNPVWSPDGRFLYFVSNRSGNHGFWRVPIDESTGRPLGEPEPVVTPSTFSRHLSFDRSGSRMIYVQSDVQSNIQGVRFDPENLAAVGSPFWITEGDREVSRAELSPDGKRFQMRLLRWTQDDIVTFSREGTDWRDLTNDRAFDRYSRWSPDGSRIAFTSDRSGDSEIWIINADGSNLTQITSSKDTGHISTFPVWSPDGTQIAFASPNDVHVVDLARQGMGEKSLRSTLPKPDDGDIFVPWDWSPDGKKIAGRFRVPNSGAGFFSFETRGFVRLPDTKDAVPSWLPDSRHVIYGEANEIILLDTVTLQKREILSSDVGLPRSPFISRDGQLLYWVLHKDESDIWLLDLTGLR